MFTLVELPSIISAKVKPDEFWILFPSITVTELPTVFKDWGVFPGAITITGISCEKDCFKKK